MNTKGFVFILIGAFLSAAGLTDLSALLVRTIGAVIIGVFIYREKISARKAPTYFS